MDVYSHIIEGMQSDAMALLDEVLSVAKNGILKKINVDAKHHVEQKPEFSFCPCSSAG
jgi:hypothetical protein